MPLFHGLARADEADRVWVALEAGLLPAARDAMVTAVRAHVGGVEIGAGPDARALAYRVVAAGGQWVVVREGTTEAQPLRSLTASGRAGVAMRRWPRPSR